jgi:5-(carboxyamino)imidazole ribonucleotide synthase
LVTPSTRPIGPYDRKPASVLPWDPRTVVVADRVKALVAESRPDLVVEHIGSTSVPGLPGKGVVDLVIATDPADVPALTALLLGFGFGPQPGPDPFPPTRPMLVGTMAVDGAAFRIHLHVQPGGDELVRDLAFRDALLADPELAAAYAALKTEIVASGHQQGLDYTYRKQAWIADVHRRAGLRRRPISPPAVIGILGGGQLGRMLAQAARSLGYRVAVLDPDPACPAAAVADEVIVGSYDDVGAAMRLADVAAVVTYELEHVAQAVVRALELRGPVRPGRYPLVSTQDRIAERRFVEAAGAAVAPWREVRTTDELSAAADALGLPLRLKAATGGYDGRSQLRLASTDELDDAIARLGRPAGSPLLAETELTFLAELSVVVARGVEGEMQAFPIARNVHDKGILVESVAPAPIPDDVAARATQVGQDLAISMGLCGTLTAELFWLQDGSIVVNELAPRVHNSGHWTLDGAETSQFEQHIRAITGLGLGSPAAFAPTAVVNLLGTGPLREASLAGLGDALSDPAVHLHLYDKRRVFERRKMGHLAATGPDVDVALERARAARAALHWEGES